MTIEIDQSGKIEETNRDTVVAFSNGKSYSIKISGKTKRKLQEIFRRIGEPRTFVIHTFCVLIFLAIKKYTTENDQVIIDLEYVKKEKAILNTLEIIFGIENLKLPEIHFKSIGKHSKAHKKAIEAFRKKTVPDKIISFFEINKIMFEYQNRRPVLKHRR